MSFYTVSSKTVKMDTERFIEEQRIQRDGLCPRGKMHDCSKCNQITHFSNADTFECLDMVPDDIMVHPFKSTEQYGPLVVEHWAVWVSFRDIPLMQLPMAADIDLSGVGAKTLFEFNDIIAIAPVTFSMIERAFNAGHIYIEKQGVTAP